MIWAISIGAAVTSQTRWPSSRCSWARARVPGQIRCAIALVEDLLAELLELGDGVAGDEAQRRRAGLGDVLGVLDADDPEVGLLPGRAEDVAGREELAPVQPAGEVEDARALHHGVVDVEERRRARGPAGGSSADSTSVAAAAASPASVDRCCRLRGRGRAVGGRHTGRVDPAGAGRRVWKYPPMSGIRDVAELVTEAAAESPDRLAVVEAGGRSLTWAELDDEVGRVATGLAASGIVGGHRVLIAIGNRIEFVTTYLGVLRAQAVAVPVNPLATAGELARMIADSGARMVVADADTVVTCAARSTCCAARSTAATRSTRARGRAVVPRVVVVGATLLPGERSYDHLRADAGPAGAAAAGPGEARGPALHQRYVGPARAPRCSPTARCSPTSSRSPRSSRR